MSEKSSTKSKLPLIYFLLCVTCVILTYVFQSMALGIVVVVGAPILGAISIIYSIIVKEYKTIIWGVIIAATPFIMTWLGTLLA